MRKMVISLILTMPATAALASAECGIANRGKVEIGSRSGIKGICSNNKLPITCIYRESEGITCDGPSGGYTGYDLDSLIFSACGCSVEYEKELQLKKELEAK
jgi:hypothetical protein